MENTKLLATSDSAKIRPAEDDKAENRDSQTKTPLLLEEIHLEKITIDGICGVY